MSERVYTVNETFDVLNQYKITSNIESVRRWLRDGTIAGIASKSRKEGWKVTQTALDALEADAVRAAMWRELVSKNIWEGYVLIKKLALKAAEQRGYSQALVNLVWERCLQAATRQLFTRGIQLRGATFVNGSVLRKQRRTGYLCNI